MTPPRKPPTLTTARLILAPLVAHDLEFTEVLLNDREVLRAHPKPHARVEASRWLEQQLARYAHDGHGMWLVRDRATAEPTGMVGLLMQTVEAWAGVRAPEIAFALHRSWWGRGYATEAALRVRTYAFEACGYPRVIALVRPANERAQGVARRLGMRPVARTTHAGHPHIVWGIDHRAVGELAHDADTLGDAALPAP